MIGINGFPQSASNISDPQFERLVTNSVFAACTAAQSAAAVGGQAVGDMHPVAAPAATAPTGSRAPLLLAVLVAVTLTGGGALIVAGRRRNG